MSFSTIVSIVVRRALKHSRSQVDPIFISELMDCSRLVLLSEFPFISSESRFVVRKGEIGKNWRCVHEGETGSAPGWCVCSLP
jgi:hypothetical protein